MRSILDCLPWGPSEDGGHPIQLRGSFARSPVRYVSIFGEDYADDGHKIRRPSVIAERTGVPEDLPRRCAGKSIAPLRDIIGKVEVNVRKRRRNSLLVNAPGLMMRLAYSIIRRDESKKDSNRPESCALRASEAGCFRVGEGD